MRFALAASVLVGVALVLCIFFVVTKRVAKKNSERRDLQRKVKQLEFTLSEVQDEIALQIQAGYSDVNPFVQILINHKELKS